MKTDRNVVILKIKKLVREIDPEAEVILFGSRARGDEKPDSDWDILILINSKADLKSSKIFRHKLFDLELEIEEAISTLVYNKQEWKSKYWMTPLFKNISNEGLIL